MSSGATDLGGSQPSALVPTCCLPPFHIRPFFRLPDSWLQSPAPDTEIAAPCRLFNPLDKVDSYHILTIDIRLNRLDHQDLIRETEPQGEFIFS